MKPGLQLQSKLLLTSLQVAYSWQSCVISKHSVRWSFLVSKWSNLTIKPDLDGQEMFDASCSTLQCKVTTKWGIQWRAAFRKLKECNSSPTGFSVWHTPSFVFFSCSKSWIRSRLILRIHFFEILNGNRWVKTGNGIVFLDPKTLGNLPTKVKNVTRSTDIWKNRSKKPINQHFLVEKVLTLQNLKPS